MNDCMNQEVWRKGHELAMVIYRTTERFPENEPPMLGDDLKCTALCVEGRIEEGLLENGSRRGRIQFGIALAKLARMESLVISCSDRELLTSDDYRKTRARIGQLRKMLWPMAGLRLETFKRRSSRR